MIDLFINVSETEGIPVSIMEAMSFGIPCIATNVGGNPEIVNATNGFLISANPSVEEIKKVLIDFMQLNTEKHIELRRNARKTWEQNFNAESNYTQFFSELSALNL